MELTQISLSNQVVAHLNIMLVKQEVKKKYQSCDAPPIDFSYRQIKTLQEIRYMMPRQGQRKDIPLDWGKQKKEEKGEEKDAKGEQGKDKGEGKKVEKKAEPVRLVPEMKSSIQLQNILGKQGGKNQQRKRQNTDQKIKVKLVCCSLILGYNKLRSLQLFQPVVEDVMVQCKNLAWLDLSHNYLEDLDYDFAYFKELRTIYLHCNFLSKVASLKMLENLPSLRSLTIHGNPIVLIPNFRLHIIGVLPRLKNLDSVVVSRKEVDNSLFFRTQPSYKLPAQLNPATPPKDKDEMEHEGKSS